MFDFMFGGKRKLELIRELLEQRMREEGFDDMDSRLKVKELGKLQLIGTPEGAIVTIVETVVKSQRQGALLSQILASIENHRKSLGSDPQEFSEIMNIASGPQAGESVGIYCHYRLNLEHPGLISLEQCMKALEQCAQEIATW
ncbi:MULTISPECIES: hypothetical protein [Cycloclasticus]|jgi:hypothetical protein|uniref:Tir chaperone protein (CesT) family protein n=1 Tax=Cycloclasticus pugetii TaxID=34068 RepID=A0AB33Z2W4_9GAMM|nr:MULTISPECIES: hypothetical protein [Cycloclasticus]ATI03144.1 hypothetical protein CPC19_06555 [Cycloclasticus sp. PY97N]EPD13419.1 hypothetical protein L196_05186 [Cycloclasticus pugetii]